MVVFHVRDIRKEDELDEDVICERSMERIRAELEFFGFKVSSMVVEGNPAKRIDRVAQGARRISDSDWVTGPKRSRRRSAGECVGRGDLPAYQTSFGCTTCTYARLVERIGGLIHG